MKRWMSVLMIVTVLLVELLPVRAGAENGSPVFLKTRESIINHKTGREGIVTYEYEFNETGEVSYCRSSVTDDQGTYYQYYEDGKLKQENGVIDEAFPDYFMAGYPYETHYDKYGTQIEWYENYYTGATQVAHEPGIPYWTDYPIEREYNEDGQISSFSAKGPVKIWMWEPGVELPVEYVDIKASYQYDVQGRILSYRIERSAGDLSNDGFFRYYDDGSYTEFLRVFRDPDTIHSWFYMDFNADKLMTKYEVHEYISPHGFEYENVTIREYTYDEQGRLLQETYFRNGQEEGGERYEYTDNGRQTVIKLYSDWNSLYSQDIEIVVQYDEYGNEIERHEYYLNSREPTYSRITEYAVASELQ